MNPINFPPKNRAPASLLKEWPEFDEVEQPKLTFKLPSKPTSNAATPSTSPNEADLILLSRFNNLNSGSKSTSLSTPRNNPSLTPPPTLPGISDPSSQQDPLQPSKMPFRFLALVPSVQENILSYVLPCDEAISPWYAFGCSRHPNGSFNGNFELENIDHHVFLVSKEVSRTALHLYYGRNDFQFHGDPELAKWWCKRIGRNMTLVKSISFFLSTGFPPALGDEGPKYLVRSQTFESTYEQRWCQFFGWLRTRQALRELWVDFRSFAGWSGMDSVGRLMTGYEIDEFEEIDKYRNHLLNVVTDLEIAGEVVIVPGSFLMKSYAQELARMMRVPVDNGIIEEVS